MKISFNSITFKTLFLLFVASVFFIFFIFFSANYSFSKGYKNLVQEDISSILESISSSIALNISYGFKDAINEIGETQLKNKKILLLAINSSSLHKSIVFTNATKNVKSLVEDNHFISTADLTDPATNTKIGEITLVYSNNAYKSNMKHFYLWFGVGTFIFIVFMILLGVLLYNSLKHLTTLASSFETFNPNEPESFNINSKKDDEVGKITKSANIMVKNLIDYIKYNKELNNIVLQKESHLKDAQRIANVGSWEYNIIDDKLTLSDEIYRIFLVKSQQKILWNDFLNFIIEEDYDRVVNIINEAIINGSEFNIKYAIKPLHGDNIHIKTKGKVRKKKSGDAKITAVSMNITKDVKNKEIIEKLAYYDSLTGLANRSLLNNRMHKVIQNSNRENLSFAVMFLDLDHFKLINDTLGHNVGDQLLIYISNILKSTLRESDTVARFGGDEFIIMIQDLESKNTIENVALKILKAFDNKHDIGSHQLYITSSIGISIYPQDGLNTQKLISNADTAMYAAKNDGRNGYKFYENSMGNYVNKQLNLEQDLVQAVNDDKQIEIFYQPKINLRTNMIEGAEALVRWRHPSKGLIYPDDFISIAESTGLMINLGCIIIDKSISQLKVWTNQGYTNFKLAINLSPRQFQDSNITSFISQTIDKYQVNPAQIELEITETLSMSNLNNTLRILNELKSLGVSIAIDDFGTGHSSLAYLKKFPINILKIDRSFIMDITTNEEDKIIVNTIIIMAHSLGFLTVAEGVESIEHVNMLEEMGSDIAQGYYFSKPISKDDFTDYMLNYKPNEQDIKI